MAVIVAIGLTFGLPHLLIPYLLGRSAQYTPFAIDNVSSLTYDESFLYAAQTNYTALRWEPAYDTDVFEYRNAVSTMPVFPLFAVALLAKVVGAVGHAFIACDFLLPPLAFLLVALLLRGITDDLLLAILGASFTILVSFGPRNFFRPVAELATTGRTSALQPLEYSRLLHPEFSFTCFLAALLLLWRTFERSSLWLAVSAGILGGSLFYMYLYYGPVWFGACALLWLAAWYLRLPAQRPLGVALVVAAVGSGYFWLSYVEARARPEYPWRAARFGVELGHRLRPDKVQYTAAALVVFLLFLAVFLAMERRRAGDWSHQKRAALYLGSTFLAACAALNAEVVTGINVEAMEHYPNRVFQPLLCMTFFALPVAGILNRCRRRTRAWWCLVGTVCLLAVAVGRQVAVAVNTAPYHAYPEEQRVLYSWLNSRTRMDDVVLCSISEVSYLMPTYTHNRLYVPNGTRTVASNAEILHRFLVGAKLFGKTEEWVHDALAQDYEHAAPPGGHTYVYYLFQANYDSPNRRLREGAIARALEEYRGIDLKKELGRFRLDYVYVRRTEHIVPVEGFSFSEVQRSRLGTIYSVSRR